jgi:hypothetical protein
MRKENNKGIEAIRGTAEKGEPWPPSAKAWQELRFTWRVAKQLAQLGCRKNMFELLSRKDLKVETNKQSNRLV